MPDALKIEKRDHVLEITLDRPKANAIDAATSREMSGVFVEFQNDPDLWVAILTGKGRFFSAGWDLKAAAAGEDEFSADYGEGGFGGLIHAHDLNKPIIAALNGICLGGALEIALACDIMIASTEATMGLAEVKVGVVPTGGGIIRLPNRVPHGIAMQMLYTGNAITAEEAYRVGLVTCVVTPEELMDTARGIAADIVKSSPLSVRAIKSIMKDICGLGIEAAFDIQEHNPDYRRAVTSEDYGEGQRAFAENRKPQWKCR